MGEVADCQERSRDNKIAGTFNFLASSDTAHFTDFLILSSQNTPRIAILQIRERSLKILQYFPSY